MVEWMLLGAKGSATELAPLIVELILGT